MGQLALGNYDELKALPGGLLVAQQLIQHGGLHVLEYLLEHGVTHNRVESMYRDMQRAERTLIEVAKQKGVELNIDRDVEHPDRR